MHGRYKGYLYKLLRVYVMAISIISLSSDSSEDNMGTPAERIILFGTIPTTIPDTTPTISEDPSSDHIPSPKKIRSPDSAMDLLGCLEDSFEPYVPREVGLGVDVEDENSEQFRSRGTDVEVDDDVERSDEIDIDPVEAFIEACFDYADIIRASGVDVRVEAVTVSRDDVETIARDPIVISDDEDTPPVIIFNASSDLHVGASSILQSRNSLSSIFSHLPTSSAGHLTRDLEDSFEPYVPREVRLGVDVEDESSEQSRSRGTNIEVDDDDVERSDGIDIDLVEAIIEACFDFADIIRVSRVDVIVKAVTLARDDVEMITRDPIVVSLDEDTPPAVPGLSLILLRRKQQGVIEEVQREQGCRIVEIESAVTALTKRIAELERDNRRLRGTVSVESQRFDDSQAAHVTYAERAEADTTTLIL
ncbi:hypothetical protein Tco_0806270 [Tanacetum coccineum]